MIHSEIVQFLSEIDTNIFLSFNGIHSPFWDYFMSSFTGKIIWVPMYATILYILLRNFHWKVVVCYVAAIALTITFADQMCSSIIRPVVARLRPANPDNPIVDMVYSKKNPNTGKGISTFNDNTPEYMLAEMYQGAEDRYEDRISFNQKF